MTTRLQSPFHLVRPRRFILLSTSWACFSASAVAADSAAGFRVWQDIGGRKIEAVFKGVDGDHVKLGLAGGEVLPFPLTRLSEADREWLKNAATAVPGETAELHVPEKTDVLLDQYCYSCHEDGTEKGDVRLDNLAELPLDARLDLMNRMQEQVYLGQMPPKKKKSQPDADERKALVDWVAGELGKHNASRLEDKMRYPSYGNYVDHDKLFSGTITDMPFTPARRWLVSPQIFEQRVFDVFELDGAERGRPLDGVTNPFLLPDASGVRYYDNGTLDGGHLLVMLGNAEWISNKQIRPARVKSGEIRADEYPDPKDKWSPRQTPAAFEAVITGKSAPRDGEIIAAIGKQFELVLRREPTDEEMSRYLKLTREAIGLGGNTEGLRQMLVAVLLESEFLYRLEFGAGASDGHGRKLLSPGEGAHAISYALGDRGPDAALLKAAAEGRLVTKEDYKREVLRLLADQNYYRGPVDPGISGMHLGSLQTPHPRIVRFFREFFGYPLAVKVFKDTERSGGIYRNPDRGTLATPGFLVDEADRIVALHLETDRNLFENLLTTDGFFVYHNKDNETGAKLIEGWRTVYETLKNTDWRKNPEKVVLEHEELVWKYLQIKPGAEKTARRHGNNLTRCMEHFELTFGHGLTPFTTFPWQHGNTHWHSPIYNLPETPQEKTKYSDGGVLDYHPVQPFRIEHRKGILTHPAWLVAFSQNTQSDPVIRGRWVREKLLAGRVPDIPITVDAQIPEDHQKTLRSRLEDVTSGQECMKCHQYMNPLGLPFEMYDDFGRFRSEEPLEHPENVIGKNGKHNIYKALKIDTKGTLDSTGDPALDGEVTDAIDMIGRLAKSGRARQSIIRHAFRFYMGRNETLADSRTLIDADKAYLASGGSFKAVIVSLLTSDSFMYRK